MSKRRITYIIDGKEYIFEHVCQDGKRAYGYCARLHKWAWLYSMFIQFQGEHIKIAERV